MKRFAVVKFEFQGIHCWPEAEGEQAYLRNPHRHVFHCAVYVEQFHADRDLEYLNLKEKLLGEFGGNVAIDLGRRSCEDIADEIYGFLKRSKVLALPRIANYVWGAGKEERTCKIEVTEDGENGVLTEF